MIGQFRRVWRAQVGSLVVSDSAADARPLDISFKVKKTLGAARGGTLDMEIFNLSEEHRREIATAPRRQTYVRLDAGYEGPGGASQIFVGDLRKAIVAESGADWVVKVTAGSGEHSVRSARVVRSFAAGATVEDVVRHLASAMGVGVGNALDAFQGARLAGGAQIHAGGAVLQGRASEELDRLCTAAGLSFSVQDGVLQVLPLGGALDRSAILLSPTTGLVESPEIVNRRTITVKALLQPGLVPGQRIVVESAVISGVWRITEAEYSGANGGNDWYATMTCHRPVAPLLGARTVGPRQEIQ